MVSYRPSPLDIIKILNHSSLVLRHQVYRNSQEFRLKSYFSSRTNVSLQHGKQELNLIASN